MHISNNPELLAQLAGTYALGTLRGRARLRFEQLARNSPSIRSEVLLWQLRLSSLTELERPLPVRPEVWKRIERAIDLDLTARQISLGPGALSTRSWLIRLLRLEIGLGSRAWRGIALGSMAFGIAIATLAGLLVNQLVRSNRSLEAQIAQVPKVQGLAVLNDANASTSFLVTFDATTKTIIVKRVGQVQVLDSQSLQLWSIGSDGKPKSVMVLESKDQGRVFVNPQEGARLALDQKSLFAISVEPRGGVPEAGGPTGPVLFKGNFIPGQI